MNESKVLTADGASFDERVLRAAGPVLVKFEAAWCNPCQAMKPTLEAVAEEQADKVSVVAVDIGESPELAQRYGVRSLPTLLLFKGGQPVVQKMGLARKEDVVAMLT